MIGHPIRTERCDLSQLRICKAVGNLSGTGFVAALSSKDLYSNPAPSPKTRRVPTLPTASPNVQYQKLSHPVAPMTHRPWRFELRLSPTANRGLERWSAVKLRRSFCHVRPCSSTHGSQNSSLGVWPTSTALLGVDRTVCHTACGNEELFLTIMSATFLFGTHTPAKCRVGS